MTASTPPPPPTKAALGFDLTRIAFGVALAIPVGISAFWAQGPAAAWSWTGGSVWALANLYCLDRTIRAALAPPGEVDGRTAALFGTLTLLVLPALLLGLLYWCMRQATLAPVAAGLTLPLIVVVLRAIGTFLRSRRSSSG